MRKSTIRYRARGFSEGKEIRTGEVVRALAAIVAHRFTRLRG